MDPRHLAYRLTEDVWDLHLRLSALNNAELRESLARVMAGVAALRSELDKHPHQRAAWNEADVPADREHAGTE